VARHALSTKGQAKGPAIKAVVTVLLTVAVVGALWVPIYARTAPKLGAFPFFYWYQLILVPVTALLCWISYLLLRTRPARKVPQAPQAAGRDREGAWR
jgi:protein-S-isoprenylcysteine O-methyltransferase Ste14